MAGFVYVSFRTVTNLWAVRAALVAADLHTDVLLIRARRQGQGWPVLRVTM